MSLQAKLEQGMALYQQGRLTEAERICRAVLRQQQNHFGALHLLGVIALQNRHAEQAVDLLAKAIALNAGVATAHSNLGKALLDLKRATEALASCDKAIALAPDLAVAHSNRGNALLDLKRPADALASFDKVVTLEPNNAIAFYNRGNLLGDLKRPADAVTSYDTAIALKPDFAMAYNNRGNALLGLKRAAEALASYDKAIALKPDAAEAHHNRGNALLDLKRPADALASYDRAIALKPDYAEAYNNRASALRDLKRPADAVASYDKSIALKPDYAEVHHNRGNALLDLMRPAEALVSYDRAVALKPDYAEAHRGRGRALAQCNRYDEAFTAYEQVYALKPDLAGAEGDRLHAKMQLCEWTNLEFESTHLIESIRSGKANSPPFVLLSIPSSSDDQFQCARLWVEREYPPSPKPIWQGGRYDHIRIRIAYLSPDFREHPVSILTAGMFECHDKSRFDVTAISLRSDGSSEMRQRLKTAFEHFIDADNFSDDQVAGLVRELEIDILVDLAGFTEGSRTGIFARRPAPVQVNYLGYAGTMGAKYFDYIVADRFVVPEETREFFSEKVVYLPDSFMGSDSKRKVSAQAPRRSTCGLPDAAFVFCVFNNPSKISPRLFDIWMRLLRRLDNSVLWFSSASEVVIYNLRREARNRGVDPSRLIFAQRVARNEDHLARYSLADLFLDTLPYNAHTTASDALWVGLPVLTCLGETFAGRVAGSLLNAIGVPELITTSLDGYEQMAIDLATHPEKLALIKTRLIENRLATPIFDTKLFTKHIEAAYMAMYERYRAGLAPDHIIVAN